MLHHSQQVQLQGNITNIDKNRTDVVTVVDTAKLRPDLSVTKLTFPGSATINTPVNIVAVVSELNHDAGATTTVDLSIDGTVVDSAKNVWVDAGGVVSVSFTQTFTTTGGHTIEVSADNVVPSDYDTSNNSASGTITITQNNLAIQGYFYDESRQYSEGYEWKYTYNGAPFYDVQDITSYNEAYQYVYLNFTGTNVPQVQLPVNFTVVESMDGTAELTQSGIMGGFSASGFTWAEGTVNSGWLYLFSNGTVTSGYYNRNAGDVTYFSSGYQCTWGMATGPDNGSGYPTCQPQDYYSWNSSSQGNYGTRIPLGSAYQIALTFTGGDGSVYSGKGGATLNVQTYSGSYSYPTSNACPSNPYVLSQSPWVYTYCDQYSETDSYTFVGISPVQ
jgi:hypothetical protein